MTLEFVHITVSSTRLVALIPAFMQVCPKLSTSRRFSTATCGRNNPLEYPFFEYININLIFILNYMHNKSFLYNEIVSFKKLGRFLVIYMTSNIFQFLSIFFDISVLLFRFGELIKFMANVGYFISFITYFR